jgi:hypothetical protein
VPEDVHLGQPNQKTRLRRCHPIKGEPPCQSGSLSSLFFSLGRSRSTRQPGASKSPGAYVAASPLQWELLRQQQGGHYQALRIDVNLAIRYGKIIGVRVRRGTGHSDIDKAIVKWIEAYWETYPWFAGGDDYVISMNVDPGTRRVMFRKT